MGMRGRSTPFYRFADVSADPLAKRAALIGPRSWGCRGIKNRTSETEYAASLAQKYNRSMRGWLLLLAPALLGAADLKIDHATVAGRDLKKMQAALEAIGIPNGLRRSARQRRHRDGAGELRGRVVPGGDRRAAEGGPEGARSARVGGNS